MRKAANTQTRDGCDRNSFNFCSWRIQLTGLCQLPSRIASASQQKEHKMRTLTSFLFTGEITFAAPAETT
ncbi:MAG: hypothetical protein AAFR68_21050, partial [Pseudomonadota bacterium]